MIKKYFSKYTGQQIDEAVSALIENNVRIEDLNQEVVDLIKKGGVEIVDIPNSIVEKILSNESFTNTISLSDEEFEFFTTDYEQRVYRLSGDGIIFGVPGMVLFRLLMKATAEEENEEILYFGGNDFISFNILTRSKTLEASLAPALEGSLGVSDLEWEVDDIQNRISNTETEVSNLYDTVNGVTTYVDSEIARVEELIGSSGSTSYEKGTSVPNTGKLEKIYLNDSLTPEEVDSILDSANIEFYSTAGGYDIYELLVTNQVNNWPETIISIYKYNFSEENYGYIITTNKYTQHYPLYISPTLTDLSDVIIRNNYEKRGWMFDSSNGEDNVSNPCYIVGYPHNELQTTGIWSNVGLYNDAIASIVSTTPFTKQAINEINEELVQVHTKVDELTNSLNSLLDSPVTAVPASGTLENIYIKVPVSDTWYITDEKFIAVCEQLNFRLGSSCVYTVVTTTNANIWIGGYWNSTLQKVESFYVMASSSAGERIDFEDGSYGFVGINEEITSAGTQNDLLKDYFSITPFEKSLPEKVDALENTVKEISTAVLIDAPSLAADYSALLSGSSYVRRELTDDEVTQFTELATSDKYIGLGTNVTVDGVTASAVMYKGVYESLNNELTVTTQFGEWLILGYVNLTDKDIYLWYVSLDDIAAIKNHLYGDVYTKTEVNNIIGDINSLLDQINGEVM